MGRCFTRTKSAVTAKNASIDNGLPESPELRPSSSNTAKYRPEDRSYRSHPARVIRYNVTHPGDHHDLSYPSYKVQASPVEASHRRSRPSDSAQYVPRSRSRQRGCFRHSPSPERYYSLPLSRPSSRQRVHRSPTPQSDSTCSESVSARSASSRPNATPNIPRFYCHYIPRSEAKISVLDSPSMSSTYEDYERHRPRVPKPGPSRGKYARAPDFDDRHHTLSSRMYYPSEARTSTPATALHRSLAESAYMSPQVSIPTRDSYVASNTINRSDPNRVSVPIRFATRSRPAPRYVPDLQACNVCLDSHPQSAFPAMPATSTCAHPVKATCTACLQQHLATQITSRGGAALRCVCHQPLSFEDVQRHATPADFALYSERYAISVIERYANFVWCPRSGCSGGQIHEAGDSAPIVTCAACLQRFCYSHRVGWHAGLTCAQYDALTADEQVEAMEGSGILGKRSLPSSRMVQKQSSLTSTLAELAERRQRRSEEVAGEEFVRSSGAKACPQCGYMTVKDGGCKHMTCRKCQNSYCWTCREAWVYGHLSENCS